LQEGPVRRLSSVVALLEPRGRPKRREEALPPWAEDCPPVFAGIYERPPPRADGGYTTGGLQVSGAEGGRALQSGE